MRDPGQQLDLLHMQTSRLAPVLYRDLALYLQVLRQELLPATRNAVLQLLVHQAPSAYLERSDAGRRSFHRFLERAIQRCGSLLTVEQLLALASVVEAEQRAEWLRQARRVVVEATEVRPPAPVQNGSVELSMQPPLDSPWIASGFTDPGSSSSQPGEETAAVVPMPARGDLPMLDAFLQLAAQPSERPAGASSGGEPAEPEDSEQHPGGSGEINDASFSLLVETGHLLPRQPQHLLAWWERLEQALSRRLRNLSHAVNTELMRSRFSTSLLPLSLLQAVLDGQVEPQAARANLLTLSVPVPSPQGGTLLETQALLLRPADLEETLPRLRQCRQRLEERRRQLRRMARQHRYWSGRARTMEVEQAWARDVAQTSRPRP
ncbi:hypothetical protein EVJ50_04425 [Synechococcus sp. RSCCF101]|uniref:hypothetical protein n=1 Tax=Synechococcus sp. RSCCF101 TaxID=2511069 RepID=UPI001248ACA7|nr:hypothetical protein [Synechococcus sp. RSCCF101]QEY31610.1 hypothetical protein EVJ50_04425 [Synechococcus sp. RSCCF101]